MLLNINTSAVTQLNTKVEIATTRKTTATCFVAAVTPNPTETSTAKQTKSLNVYQKSESNKHIDQNEFNT